MPRALRKRKTRIGEISDLQKWDLIIPGGGIFGVPEFASEVERRKAWRDHGAELLAEHPDAWALRQYGPPMEHTGK